FDAPFDGRCAVVYPVGAILQVLSRRQCAIGTTRAAVRARITSPAVKLLACFIATLRAVYRSTHVAIPDDHTDPLSWIGPEERHQYPHGLKSDEFCPIKLPQKCQSGDSTVSRHLTH